MNKPDVIGSTKGDLMGVLVGPDGTPVDKEGKPVHVPGLDMRNPVESLDLLASVGKGFYIMAAQYASLAGVKGERHIKMQARDVSSIAGQGATVTDFASNLMAELSFTLAECEARLAVLKGMIPEDKQNDANNADMAVATEWDNRRTFFSFKVPVLLKQKKRIGLGLAESISGSVPTAEDFEKLKAEAEAAGLKVEPPAETPAEAPQPTVAGNDTVN